jgi:hypothetical protein
MGKQLSAVSYQQLASMYVNVLIPVSVLLRSAN